ncbi:M20/M25/M40 family metallo-hydrolase [Ferviditalea candida]|uniref:M20/M25/M40 family metallo-hydrolase n=1 Tax=Ferviditalea candida TaxID=3108399 RepID=A0ABU5ZLL8_9BACL|nr:M20/M25/M40 family metallo-hydrolase [Paenibacillaceae bacterium T2]
MYRIQAHLQSGRQVHPYIAAAAKAYESVYGVPTVYKRTGGSIPTVEVCARLMNAPVVMMGFGLPDGNVNAPNEHFHLENYEKGLRVLCQYWDELGK